VVIISLAVCRPAGAIAIAAGDTLSESFSIGTSATASLPDDWRMDKNTSVRSVGSYAAAGTVTELRAGNMMSATAQNGMYNFGAGAADTATDRALGGLSSSSASKSVNVCLKLTNAGSTAITNFVISYKIEKYRNGSNAAGFAMQVHYSADGTAWTSAGDTFVSAWDPDSDNSGFASAPGATKSVAAAPLNQSLAPGATLYLAWNYSVRTGSTTSSAQGLGLDDVVITALGAAGSGPAASSNAVYLLQPAAAVVTAAPHVALAFTTRSWSNGTAQTGYGASATGSGWSWVDAALSNSATGAFIATNHISIATTGTYYYAARWNVSGTNYYGTNAGGQVNLFSLSGGAQQRIVITSPPPAGTTVTTITMCAANISSGNNQQYLGPGVRILQALQPDIVGIQEFLVTDVTERAFVDRVFGPSFHFYREGGVSLPNGIISRWPILASGVWNVPDAIYPDRNYVWATIDIPGPAHLHVISVHLSSDSTERPNEAVALTNFIRGFFNTNDYIVLAGDLNTASDGEAAMLTLQSLFSDSQQPADAAANKNTNEPRNKRYDFVLPNHALNALQATTSVAGALFPAGIVFDTRTWGGTPPAPARATDSGAGTSGTENFQMQHMAVMKTFLVQADAALRASNTLTRWTFTNGVTAASHGGTFTVADGITTNWEGAPVSVLRTDGYSANDLDKWLVFRASTIGCQHIGFRCVVKRDATGPRTLLLQYTAHSGDAGWTAWDHATLPGADVWYTNTFDCSDVSSVNNNASTGFRLIGTNAIGSTLYLQSAEILYGVPESGLLALTVLASAWMARR